MSCSTPGFLILHFLPELAQTLNQWCHPTISPSVVPFSCPQSFPASGSFPMCWLFSISPSNEYSGLISSRIDWFDLLAVQGTLKHLSLQHHSSKVSILWCSAFFIVQLSHPYMTTRKTTALTIWTFVRKMSLLFNTLYRFVIAFLPRSKHSLILWLQSLKIWETVKVKKIMGKLYW